MNQKLTHFRAEVLQKSLIYLYMPTLTADFLVLKNLSGVLTGKDKNPPCSIDIKYLKYFI